MKYEIEIRETLSRILIVDANSKDEALDTIKNKYKSEEIVLSGDDFQQVDFLCR